ncbi:MAG: TetR family transcriptional regulator [Gammaproteobacteria bacterium]|nr:TetR family transcriptional regulator [Gemmatimonadota bacterium]NIU73178.1 TetR family transcriptional regulator [Gammaproteobacteria bacterium]NIY07646.1 TetR family transcriptional regulator [Gemmatimonadota bacterium]
MPGKKLPEEERREAILAGAFRVAVREQLGGLSMRAVAEEAGVSKGLVFFHFSDKETLLLALLDWLLEGSPRMELPPDLEGVGDPARRLLALVEHQVGRLPDRRAQVKLFLDFWVMGMGVPGIQERIREAFDRYRDEFVPYTSSVVESLPERYGPGSADGLAAAVVGFIQGCALQLNAAPESFSVDAYVGALRGLVGRE